MLFCELNAKNSTARECSKAMDSKEIPVYKIKDNIKGQADDIRPVLLCLGEILTKNCFQFILKHAGEL